MRLGKKARVFLGVGIFAILMGSLIMAYLEQDREQDQLSQELSSAELLFEKQEADFESERLPLRVGILESQLTRIDSELVTVKTRLHRSIESTRVTETCFDVAEIAEVEIIKCSSQNSTTVDMEGVNLSILSLTVTAEGNISKLVDFIRELSGQFPTGVQESVEIDVEQQSATVTMSIHTYEGD
ncbi:hypothetical protein ES703_79618 [subsurface metagenome]